MDGRTARELGARRERAGPDVPFLLSFVVATLAGLGSLRASHYEYRSRLTMSNVSSHDVECLVSDADR